VDNERVFAIRGLSDQLQPNNARDLHHAEAGGCFTAPAATISFDAAMRKRFHLR
jgi:hypothetical protein